MRIEGFSLPRLLRIARALLRTHKGRNMNWGDTPHSPRQELHPCTPLRSALAVSGLLQEVMPV
jgi:hypothetical protein